VFPISELSIIYGTPIRQPKFKTCECSSLIVTGVFAREMESLLGIRAEGETKTNCRKVFREVKHERVAISMGTTDLVAAMRLPSMLFRHHSEYLDVEIRISTGTTEDLLVRLLDFQLDAHL
jgi:hypothetical protein